MQVYISSPDIDLANAKINNVRRQMPFAQSVMINKTMLNVQEQLRSVTYADRPEWTVRNRQLGKALTTFRNVDRANKRKLFAKLGPAMSRGRLAGDGFVGRQRTGQTKRPRGSAIALPQLGPGLRRLKGGGISAAKKPRANKKLFKVKGRRGAELLMERQAKNKARLRYVLVKKARGTNPLKRMPETVLTTVKANAQGHFNEAVAMALRTAKKPAA